MAKYRASLSDFVRNTYYSYNDRFRLNEEQIKEVLSYKNISEDFEYSDWYGSTTKVKATMLGAELDRQFGNLIFEVNVTPRIPEHYYPSLVQIMKGKGLLMPVSYQVL